MKLVAKKDYWEAYKIKDHHFGPLYTLELPGACRNVLMLPDFRMSVIKMEERIRTQHEHLKYVWKYRLG